MRLSTGRKTRYGRWSSARRSAAFAASLGVLLGACGPVRTPAPVTPPVSGEVPLVRVGVLVDSAQVELGAATAFSLIDAASGELLAREPAQTRVRVTRDPAGGLVVSAGGSTYPVRERLTLRPENDGMVLISGAPYRGTVTVVPGARGVTAINVVDMESYLLGVVPFEIGRVGEELFEASRAQAVAARTYAMRFLGRRSALGFDVFATVDDQVYGGAGGEHEPVSAAVRATRGELLTYRGEPIEALYHSTCAGVTAAIEEVWPEVPRPYLRSVVDTNPATGEAFDVSSSRFRWTTTWTADELQTILNRTLADSLSSTGVRGPGAIRSFEIDRLTPSGRIGAMRIITDNGDFIVGGDRIRWIFPTPVGTILNSSKFDLRIESDTRGQLRTVTAEGMGWGHGIGMCQVGAMGRARAGQDYRTILSAYYRDTVLTRLY